MVFAWAMFPKWHINVAIPSIALAGVGAWMFGRLVGLILILPSILYHYILLSVIYADIFYIYQAKVSGITIWIIVVTLTGNLKKNLISIRSANENLDRLVAERNTDLAKLANDLLDRAENMRVATGQELHDGIGQHLTGIQLFSLALAENLATELNTSASLAYSLRNRARVVHSLIRRAARALFPVRMEETGLLPALEELSGCFHDLYGVEFTFSYEEPTTTIPQPLSIQLFRICQETTMALIKHSKATRIEAVLALSRTHCRLSLHHDGQPKGAKMHSSPEARLIEYRLAKIHGTSSSAINAIGQETVEYDITLDKEHV